MNEGQPFSRHPDVLQGQTVFAGTRVPLDIVQSYKREGGTLEEFMENHPGVARWQAEHAWRLPTDALEALIVAGAASLSPSERDAIRRGLDGIASGTGEDAHIAFESLERELGIPEDPVFEEPEKAAADSLFEATPEELGQAALDKAQRDRKNQ